MCHKIKPESVVVKFELARGGVWTWRSLAGVTRGAWIAAALALGAAAGAPSPAAAAAVISERVSVEPGAGTRCVERPLAVPATGYLTARLRASSGDWDLSVVPRSGGDRVAASKYTGAIEVASGFADRGDDLSLRACRLSGRSDAADVSVDLEPMEPTGATASLVEVSTPTPDRKRELTRLGLDLTEHGGDGFIRVVLHGEEDAAKLRDARFAYKVKVPDMGAQDLRDRAADARFDAAVGASALPSGRATYRRLDEYTDEMRSLADANPGIAESITLPHPSVEGRPVQGLEISTSPGARDGKPVFVLLGLHHANEWPSGEHAVEWARELVDAYNAGDARTRALVERVRTIVVPVVNPDGFNFSREAPAGSGPEFQRKNCRPPPCAAGAGVDLNRNYGDLWGGIGSSGDPAHGTFRGPAPFSEPEAQNVRELIAGRQVVVMITNHTSGRLILRQPGLASEPRTPDEPAYRSLGAAFAAENSYSNQFSYQLYDHVGTTDGWSYYSTGGLGYVFEIGSGLTRRTARSCRNTTAARCPAAATARRTTSRRPLRPTRRPTPSWPATPRPARSCGWSSGSTRACRSAARWPTRSPRRCRCPRPASSPGT